MASIATTEKLCHRRARSRGLTRPVGVGQVRVWKEQEPALLRRLAYRHRAHVRASRPALPLEAFAVYRGTSLKRKRPPPYGHHMSPGGGVFL